MSHTQLCSYHAIQLVIWQCMTLAGCFVLEARSVSDADLSARHAVIVSNTCCKQLAYGTWRRVHIWCSYPIRSSRVTGNRSSSLYAGIMTDSDFVASEKMDGGGTYRGATL